MGKLRDDLGKLSEKRTGGGGIYRSDEGKDEMAVGGD